MTKKNLNDDELPKYESVLILAHAIRQVFTEAIAEGVQPLREDIGDIREGIATKTDIKTIRENIGAIRENMATKADIKTINENMATKTGIKTINENMQVLFGEQEKKISQLLSDRKQRRGLT